MSRKGTPNRNRAFFLRQLREQFGEDFDPICKLAQANAELHKIAMKNRNTGELKMAVDGWDKLAQYLVPKLKAMEVDVTGEVGIELPKVIRLVAVHQDGSESAVEAPEDKS